MITFVCGKPGGGKSYICLHKILQNLTDTQRYIVTNIPLRRDLIADKLEIDAFNRIRIIDDDEVQEFYRRRLDQNGEFDLELGQKEKFGYELLQTDQIYERDENHPGTLFVIDEVHIFYHARLWQKVGMTAQHYFTQHRKLNDEIILNTQNIEQVEKQLRKLGQEYWLVKNYAREKKGIVRHSRYFHVYKYYSAEINGRKAQEEEKYQFDNSIFPLYDTSQGAGIKGKGAETTPLKKGIPIRAFIAMAILGIFALGLTFNTAANKGTKMLVENHIQPKYLEASEGISKFGQTESSYQLDTRSDPQLENPQLQLRQQETSAKSVSAILRFRSGREYVSYDNGDFEIYEERKLIHQGSNHFQENITE